MEAAQTAATEARQARVALVHHLVAGGHVSAAVVARSAAEEFGDPLIDLNTFSKEMMVKDLVDPKLITKHSILPLLRRGSRLFVAVSDPTNLPALEEIRFNTGLNVETVIVEDEPFEITTFRRAVSTDGRRAVVHFAKVVAEDARRRDFTMNALYARPDGEVVDPLGGEHLTAGVGHNEAYAGAVREGGDLLRGHRRRLALAHVASLTSRRRRPTNRSAGPDRHRGNLDLRRAQSACEHPMRGPACVRSHRCAPE